jgi:hypothetical protein
MTRLSVAVRVFSCHSPSARFCSDAPVTAADEYPAPAFFLDGVTAESRWSEIRAKPA